MAIALISHLGYQPGANGGTSPPIDTTGANFLVANLVIINGGIAVLTDSYSNIWIPLTAYGNSIQAQLYYAKNATTGTGHTFTVTCSGQFPGLAVASFSGVDTASPFDNQTGAVGSSVTSLASGTLTPNFNNELMISGFGTLYSGAPPTSSVGTITDSLQEAASWGVGIAYLVQTTATAENVTWTQAGAQDMQVNLAFFQAASGVTFTWQNLNNYPAVVPTRTTVVDYQP